MRDCQASAVRRTDEPFPKYFLLFSQSPLLWSFRMHPAEVLLHKSRHHAANDRSLVMTDKGAVRDT